MVMISIVMPPKLGMAMGTMTSEPRPTEVSTGMRRPGLVEIRSGLNPGDVVITAGQMKIGPGSEVRAAETENPS